MFDQAAKLIGPRSLPKELHTSLMPGPLVAAERGNFSFLPEGERYTLPGGSIVNVYRWSDSKMYGAVVNLEGNYPGEGKIAVNINRTEKITLIEGSVALELNGAVFTLAPGNFAVAQSGDRYALIGVGKLVVAVHDLEGGVTATVDR